jgi:hypothetical protein
VDFGTTVSKEFRVSNLGQFTVNDVLARFIVRRGTPPPGSGLTAVGAFPEPGGVDCSTDLVGGHNIYAVVNCAIPSLPPASTRVIRLGARTVQLRELQNPGPVQVGIEVEASHVINNERTGHVQRQITLTICC